MKQLSLVGFVGLFSAIVSGCPIYDGSTSPHGTATGNCVSSWDCQANETCGSDNFCHSGDCTTWQCSAGYACVMSPTDYTASCQPAWSSGGAGGTGGGGASSSTASHTVTTTTSATPIYCGKPSDCAQGQTCAPNGTCQPGTCTSTGCVNGSTCSATGTCTSTGCDVNGDCPGTGSVCIYEQGGGVCTAPADQCFDQTQCEAGQKCVGGACILACTSNADCRDGYACNTNRGVCSTAVTGCTVTNDCKSASKVCVGGACVPRAVNGKCATGDALIENGCVPDQTPSFTCTADGVQDSCQTGSICLHHSCWIGCDPTKPNQGGCAGVSEFPLCKPVTSASGTHNVCSSAQVGSDCDPTVNKLCSGALICVDGFCE